MKALYRLGFLLRETGQALDTLGCKLQGNYSYLEQRTCFSGQLPVKLCIKVRKREKKRYASSATDK